LKFLSDFFDFMPRLRNLKDSP